MVYESEEAHKIIEDMMEEQIISTEEADLKTRQGYGEQPPATSRSGV